MGAEDFAFMLNEEARSYVWIGQAGGPAAAWSTIPATTSTTFCRSAPAIGPSWWKQPCRESPDKCPISVLSFGKRYRLRHRLHPAMNLLAGEPLSNPEGAEAARTPPGIDGHFEWTGVQAGVQGRTTLIARTERWRDMWQLAPRLLPVPCPRAGWESAGLPRDAPDRRLGRDRGHHRAGDDRSALHRAGPCRPAVKCDLLRRAGPAPGSHDGSGADIALCDQDRPAQHLADPICPDTVRSITLG